MGTRKGKRRVAHGWGVRDTVFVALVVAFGMLAAAVGVAFAVPATPVFELEGDTADNPTGTRQDWDNVYRSVTGLGSASPSTALVQAFVGDWAEPDLKTFGMSNKDAQPASAWQCNTDNNPQAKTNILHAYAALHAVNGDLHVYIGSDRESNNGDANFGFWLFQKPINCVANGATGKGTFAGTKTHGDLFVVSEYTNGGKVATTKVYVWTDPTPDAPESGDECLGNGIDCSEANAGEDHPLAAGSDCTDPQAQAINPHVCGTVNAGTIDAAWRQGLAARELFEGGINLSKLAPGRCFGTFLAETRSSQEFEADLKDFVIGDLDTCAQITVRKATVGGDGTFPFAVTAGGLAPAAFSLAEGGEQTFTQVAAGTYTIAEEPQAGWTLTDISCQTSGGATTVTKDLAAGSITVAAGLAGTVDCTFTNTRQTTLTVIKQVENLYGGTRTVGEFTLRVDGQAVTSGVPTVVAPGAHVVGEDTPPAGYVKVGITGDCDAAGNVTLAAGQAKTCTITNRDVAPRLTVVKQVVNDNGGTKTAGQFTMQVTGTDVSQPSFPGSASGVTVTLKAGTYGVDELADAGYAKTIGAGCAGTIAIGESKTCTIVNDDLPARLTVIKQVVNDNGGTGAAADFTMQVAGTAVSQPSFPGSSAGVTVTLAPGSYSVTETGPAGYTQTSAVGCSGTIALGESRTCTLVNDDVAPRLTVVKQVVNDNGGTKTAAQFTMQVTGAKVSQASFPGSAAGVTVTLDAGSYSVDEAPDAAYAKALGAGCAGTIAVGESKTCTIVNDDLAARLTVVKQVVNDNGGTKAAADFTIQVAGTAVSQPSFPGSTAGVTVTLAPGSFSVTETGPAGYTQTSAVGCSGTIALGESKTCTLINDDTAPRLTVVKQVVNDNGGTKTAAQFTMQVTGAKVSQASFPGSAAGVTVTLDAGSYSVDEAPDAAYAKALGAGCAGTIAVGESKTCTIVNDDLAARLTVVKQVVNDNGGTKAAADFTIQVAGTGVSQPSFPGSTAGLTVTLAPGSFSVSETGPAGYTQTSAVGCSGTIALGESRTCTLVNDDVAPRLTVVKHVVNGAGGRATAGDFTMLVTGTGVSQPSFPGSETGTTVTLKAGAYSVDEIAAPGYQKALSAGCAGVIGVGEERTCTVTNSAVTLVSDFAFCDDHGVQAVMNPFTGRFPNNLGPDVVVDGSAASIQAALDSATDVNGDGYILVGLVANGEAAFGLPVNGGKITQNFKISRAYGKPFGLIGCQVVVRDPHACDGVAPAIITAAATSPEHPVGSGARLFVYGVSAQGSESAPAWVVKGDGRHLEQVGAAYSVVGFRVVGNRNVLTDVTVTGAWADGVAVEGNANVVDGAVVMSGAGDGVVITGHRNQVVGSSIGEQRTGNLGVGLTVEGRANRVANNVVHGNGGDGIRVDGGTAANPNIVKANTVGAPYRGNGGHGIVVNGTGGGTAPVEIEANVVHSNFGVGVKVEGTGHQLKANRSGGAGLNANGGCEYDVAAGNWNAGGNKSNGQAITGGIGTPFPTGCR